MANAEIVETGLMGQMLKSETNTKFQYPKPMTRADPLMTGGNAVREVHIDCNPTFLSFATW